MAIITEMLGEKVISGFKGTLDYYYWLGLACVRTWPRSPGHKRSPAVQAGWVSFTEAVALWNTTPQYLRDDYNAMASGTALSGRDMFMRAYMSGLNRLYEHPTSLPPTGQRQYFAVTEWHKLLLDDGFGIYCTTSRPCHLWLRYTTVKPQKHIDPVLRRGLYMHGDPKFCFVSYHDNEQEEVGDTLTHSWVKRNWAECETRFFYFTGTIDGELSPSTSPISKLHFGYKLAESLPYNLWHVPVNKNFVEYAVFKPSLGGHPDHLKLKIGRVGEPGYLFLSLHKLKADGFPDPEAIATDSVEITGMPPMPFAQEFTFQFPVGTLRTDTWYALRAYCAAIPPVTARWYGYPNINDPDSYLMLYRTYDDSWFTYFQNRLSYLIRGTLL